MTPSNESRADFLPPKTTPIGEIFHIVNEILRLRTRTMPDVYRVTTQTFWGVHRPSFGERAFQELDAITQLVQLVRSRFRLGHPVRGLVLGIKDIEATVRRAGSTAGDTHAFWRGAGSTSRHRRLRANVDALIWRFGLDALSAWQGAIAF